MNNPKTPAEQADFNRFLKSLDNRNFHIFPVNANFRGSAMSAKHLAAEILEWLGPMECVRVSDHTGTIWYQEKRSGLVFHHFQKGE